MENKFSIFPLPPPCLHHHCYCLRYPHRLTKYCDPDEPNSFSIWVIENRGSMGVCDPHSLKRVHRFELWS
ncbi:hypothetical protein Hanom_Chr07g00591531 [Helianthus anomalus]